MITTSPSLPHVPSRPFSKTLLSVPVSNIIDSLNKPSILPRTCGPIRMEKHFAVPRKKIRTRHGSKYIKTIPVRWRMVRVGEKECCRGELSRLCRLGKKKCKNAQALQAPR